MTFPSLSRLDTPSAVVSVTAGVLVLAALVVVLVRQRAKTRPAPGERRKFSAGTLAAIASFIVCTSVSLNTSYLFTADGLSMTATAERVLSCAAFESLIAMCVLGARERLASEDHQSPGWFGSAVWIFAGLSAVPAWHEGHGLTTGTVVRIIVGSFGAALSAHSALGLELRHRTGAESQATMAIIVRDLRERLMARLGLTQRGRTAEKIARDRALSRAVDLADRHHRLSAGDKQGSKGAKLAKQLAAALDDAGCASDREQFERYRDRVMLRRNATELDITAEWSPWHKQGDAAEESRAVAQLEERVRHMEELAEDAEAAVSAQVPGANGTTRAVAPTRARAAAHLTVAQTSSAVPNQGPESAHSQPAAHAAARELHSYPTKRAALEALYAAKIAAEDPRPINAITEDLLGALAEAGITLDRGAAHRYVTALHTVQADSEPDESTVTTQVQGELVSA